MRGGLLHVLQRHPGIERGRNERVSQRVRANVLGDPGPAGNSPHDPGGAVPVQPLPSPARNSGPSERSPVARSMARAVRGASGMVTTLPPLPVITRVRWPRSRPRCSMSAPVASDTLSPLSASSEIRACSAGGPSPAGDQERPAGGSLVAGHSPAALRWASGGMVPWYADDDGSRMSRAASPPPAAGAGGALMSALSVSALGEAERERAYATLVLAFAADPMERWLYPQPWQYLSHFPKFLAAFGGRAFAARTAWSLGQSAAVALWLPPGTEADGDAITTSLAQTVATDKHHDMFAVLGQMDAAHPRYPHWYLPWFAVDIALQGTGLGTQLMEHCYGSSTLPASPPTSKPPTRAASPSTSVTVSRSPVKRRPERARRSRSCCEPRDRRPRDPAAPRYPRRARPLALPASSPRLCYSATAPLGRRLRPAQQVSLGAVRHRSPGSAWSRSVDPRRPRRRPERRIWRGRAIGTRSRSVTTWPSPSCRSSVPQADRGLATHRLVASTVTRWCQQACPANPAGVVTVAFWVATNASRLRPGSVCR